MIKKVLFLGLIFSMGLSAFAQTTPPDMVVSRIFKFSNTAATDNLGQYDAIELLVVKNNLDIRGWIVQEFGTPNATTKSLVAGGKFKFTNDALWSNLKSGTIITIREGVVVGQSTFGGTQTYTEDVVTSVSGNDFTLDISLLNTTYFEKLGANNFFFNTDNEGVMIRSGGDVNRYTHPVHALIGGGAVYWDVASVGADSPGAVYRDSLASFPKVFAAAAMPGAGGFLYSRANASGSGNFKGSTVAYTHQGWNGGTGAGGRVAAPQDRNTYDYQWGKGFTNTDAANYLGTVVTNLRNSVLPVSLLSFTAKASTEGNVLSWSTASEANHSHFEIYRSNGNGDFKFINKVSKEVSGLGVKTYQFVDKDYLSGTNYYKLRQVDKDGVFEDFEVKSVNNGSSNQVFSFFANEEKVFVSFNLPKSQTVTVSVRDISGKTVLSKKSYQNQGDNLLELPKYGVSGVYLISLQKESGEVLTNKIIL